MSKDLIKIKTNNILKLNISKIINYLEDDKVLLIKNFVSKNLSTDLKKYLFNVSNNSLPNFHPIKIRSPNNFRINHNDPRSHVRGCFLQFNFFPWNQDIFNFFKIFKNAFILKNRINRLPDEKFFFPKSDRDCTIRLYFQFYPKGSGFLNQHQDPTNYHQKYLMMMNLSKKGKDFKKGGLFVVINKKKIMIDNFSNIGDLVIFRANFKHGVEMIDPKSSSKVLAAKGRWMGGFATNFLPNNNKISSSIDNTKKKK